MPHQQVRHPRVTQPSATRTRRYAFDLHVLGTPPAFTLSQEQTLHHDLLLMPSLSLSVGPSLLQKDPQTGIKMQLVLHLRRSCFTPRASVPSLPLARLSTENHSSKQLLGKMSLLHSALVQVLGAGKPSRRGHKKPRRPSRHIGTALGNELRSSSALPTLLDVAPFPSHRRSRLLMRHSRNALVTIRHQRQPGNRLIPR